MYRFAIFLIAVACLPLTAAANVGVTSAGDISIEHCAYGRGAATISEAQAQAAAAIAAFIQGPRLLNVVTRHESLNTATVQWFKELSELGQTGIQANALPIKFGAPRLQGSDTCVTATLQYGSTVVIDAESQVDWEDGTTDVTVVVVGEGWPQGGQTARTAAEIDALRRAISQVVGMWITQQRTQFSTTQMQADGMTDSISVEELVAEQLHTKSSGLVKEWQLLDSKTLANSGLEVTIQAVVEKRPLVQASEDILQSIGSPGVRVEAESMLKNRLKSWLSRQGVEVSETANVVVRADAQLRHNGSNARLDLSVFVEDLAGNQYAHWRNDPSLIALPNSTTIMDDLVDVHLSAPNQLESLHARMHDGFISIVAQGGLIRHLTLPRSYIKQPERLSAILNTIGGVKDVSVSSDREHWSIQLRYSGATGDLLAALQQSLAPILSEPLPAPHIMDDYTIRYFK